MKKYFLLAIASFLLVGCGLSDTIKKSAKNVERQVASMDKHITKKEEEFNNSSLSKTLEMYVKRENLLAHFKSAKDEASRAKGALKALKAIVKEDNSNKEKIAMNKISLTRILSLKAMKMANKPMERLLELEKTLKEAKSIKDKAKTNKEYVVKKSENIIGFLSNEISTNDKASNKIDDLKKEITQANKAKKDVKTTFKILKEEYKKSSSMDIANFLLQSQNLAKQVKYIDAQDKRVKDKITQVNTSYTKILSDMKEKYFIVIGAVSWDNYYDYPTEHKYSSPRIEIPRETYERIVSGSGNVGTYKRGNLFGGLRLQGISQRDWNILRLNPNKTVARGDDESEIWIEDAPVEYYHKYVIVENGKKTETGWKKVSEAEYEKHYNDIGMSIVTKPYGSYESDTITTATPAGMAFVGNKNYGEWKQDSSGHSFWHYYGIYSFFTSGNNHYYRSDYDHYRSYRNSSSRKSYYGRNNSYGTFGTKTFKRNKPSRMRTSIKRGGKTSRSRTIRSVGGSTRGRGPGGGGK